MVRKHFTHVNTGLLADWIKNLSSPFLCLVPNRQIAETVYVNLETIYGDRVELLPDWNRLPGAEEAPGENIQERRLQALGALQRKQLQGLVLPLQTLAYPVLHPDILPLLELKPGLTLPPQKMAGKLLDLGFQRQPLAQERGDFALRGDLLDIFPENYRYPLRLSYFDDEIESIDYYHPNTQMQADESPQFPLQLTLQSEFALSPGQRQQLAENLRASGFPQQAKILEYSPRPHQAADWFGLWPRRTIWPEKLIKNTTTVVYRPSDCEEKAREWNEKIDAADNSVPVAETYRKLLPLLQRLTDENTCFFSPLPRQNSLTADIEESSYGETFSLTPPAQQPQPIDSFIQKIEATCGEIDQLTIHCSEESFRERLTTLLAEKLGSAEEYKGTKFTLKPSPWRGSYRVGNFALLSLDDFFNRTISRGRISTTAGTTEYLESFADLETGDLVVHEDFGIGRFSGLELVTTENQKRDCIHLEYAGSDRLYLPPDQMNRVQKYIADSGFTPPLSSLDSKRWQRMKKQVQEDVDDLARELLELYARRESGNTEPFPPDNLEQTQFEASFPYRETPDQQEAIRAVKRNMQKPKPMDRLICGDSGYGKTEVALRAAFKAASAGKQTALLAPTTLLSRQHYETFSTRFSFFPYRVELLNRFQTRSQTEQIIKELEHGKIDIIIGTHSLIKRDIEFDDLGLLIIDEEQRFGVKQKEKLKLERKNLDVLTLSATPIPRTLYMSLSGVQDISVINTPPEDRIPIKIHVGPFDPEKATEAVEHELDRGGQVFWIYNRVQGIKKVAQQVQSYLPEATVEFAHGQLNKNTLRQKMRRFYDGEIDVLVSTTIVEAGLDCPRVNTMIVQQAHRFGLAQLYQLRGRVGRSHQQAYTYLFYPEQAKLTKDAETRLQTIKECSEMGSGFQLAMRDLEIRGAGNILGRDQHGNIRAVGFPFYCRLLQRSIRRLREGFEAPEPLARLKFPGSYYIPRNYIPDEQQIITQYRELASCRDYEGVQNLAERWASTFGPLPEPVNQLLRRHVFKILAEKEGWDDIKYQNDRLNLRYSDKKPEVLGTIAQGLGAYPTARGRRYFIRNLTPNKIPTWLKILLEDELQLLNLTP